MINKYSIINGPKYFSIDGLQNCLVSTTFRKYAFTFETSKNNISPWKSIGLSEEKTINPYESDAIFSPKLNGSVDFKRIYLKQKCIFSS